MRKSCTLTVMPLALTVTSLIAIPSIAQDRGLTPSGSPALSKAQIQKRLAKRAALFNVDTRAIPTGAPVISGEGGIAGAPFQSWTFEAPLFTGSPLPGTPINGQNGFTAFQGCTGALNAPAPVVTTSAPAMTGLQWITLPKGACAANTFAGPFSPVSVQPAGVYTGTVNVRVNDVLGADYDVVFQSPTQGNIVSRVKFFYADFDLDTLNGDILVLVDPDGIGPGLANFVDSGVDYVQGQMHNVKVEVDGPGNVLKYYIDNALVSTSALTYLTTGTLAPGDRIEQWVGISDNFQNNAIDNGQFDDVVMEPGAGAACTADIAGGNNIVDVDDMLAVINAWGNCPAPCPPSCNADIAPAGGNCTVDVDDLLAVINAWGPCP